MISQDQILLERLENQLDSLWHQVKETEHKQLVHQLLRLTRQQLNTLTKKTLP